MSKIREYDGNDYPNAIVDYYNIDKRDMENLLFFVRKYNDIYLYGDGNCAAGMREYFNICGFHNIRGSITSETLQEFGEIYKKQRCGIILALNSDYYAEFLTDLLHLADIEDVLFLKEHSKSVFIRTFSREYVRNHFWISLPVTKHCNINCASCNMFAPLCPPEFYTLESIEKDIEKIKKTGLPLAHVNITGGEPFLNPEIIDILIQVRKTFPKTRIDVYTSGFLMTDYSDLEFETLKKCDLVFYITEYGICDDKLKFLYQKFDQFGIKYERNYTDSTKAFFKKKIRFKQDVPKYEYINCFYYTFAYSVFVFNGKLYKCPMAMNAEHISKASGHKLILSENDYLVLEKIESPDEIYDFWRSRLPMCSYCPRTTELINWRRSERKIEEWM